MRVSGGGLLLAGVFGYGLDPAHWNMGGADMAAACQRGQPANINSKQPGENPGLLVAERGEFSGQFLNRAMPLAKLHAEHRSVGRVPSHDGG